MDNGWMRVLVVEDEPVQADGIARGLEAEGFTVDVAETGPDGLWHARHVPYAVIVLDLLLPGMNGYVLCRTLREEGDNTPILMLTAKDGEYDEAEGLETGADDYLRKPFSFVVLVARLRALIRRGGARHLTAMTHGDLTVDPYAGRCERRGQLIQLSPREIAVLAELIRHDGEVVSKTDLLDAVWGFDFDGDPNIVEVYIHRLRKKVDEPFAVGSIRTVRGAGYQLLAIPANDEAAP